LEQVIELLQEDELIKLDNRFEKWCNDCFEFPLAGKRIIMVIIYSDGFTVLDSFDIIQGALLDIYKFAREDGEGPGIKQVNKLSGLKECYLFDWEKQIEIK